MDGVYGHDTCLLTALVAWVSRDSRYEVMSLGCIYLVSISYR